MLSAWIAGFIGVVAAFGVGSAYLQLVPAEVAVAVVGANAAAFVALLSILKLERTAWIRKHVLTRSVWTWLVFLLIFFSILLGVAPALREPRVLLALFLPLALSCGFAIVAFGPVQDRIVARIQRRARAEK